MTLELFDDGDKQHKPVLESASHPPGTAVAPMAGLVVKILAKEREKVEEGQPIIVLEAMKMEVCIEAGCSILFLLKLSCLTLFYGLKFDFLLPSPFLI